MKDEFEGKIISEFVGLKSKMYSLISVDDQKVTKARGLNKKIKHKEFVDKTSTNSLCFIFLLMQLMKLMFNKKVIRHKMKRIQSKLHKIGTYDVYKISLSCFDDKRYALNDGVSTLAYFHKDIKH